MKWAVCAGALSFLLLGAGEAKAQYNPFALQAQQLSFVQNQENQALALLHQLEWQKLNYQFAVLRQRCGNNQVALQRLAYQEQVVTAQLQYRQQAQNNALAYKHAVQWELLRQAEALYWARIYGY
jgi:hypothetical protein